MTRLKNPIGNRIERTINPSELQRMRICRRIRQRRVRQQEAQEADWAVVIVIDKPRRKLLDDLQSWSGVHNAHDIGTVYPWGNEIMLVDMRKRQRKLQCQPNQREIGSASLSEGLR